MTPLLSGQADLPSTAVVLMTKVPAAGKVKTRLIGDLTGEQAAQVHKAMLVCMLDRIAQHVGEVGRIQKVLAIDNSSGIKLDLPAAYTWQIVEQGNGSLGERMLRVWRSIGGGQAFFFGADSPDVPAGILGSIISVLERADAAIGPVTDGGYWVLGAERIIPDLLGGIDWGTARVYHQTHEAARRAGIRLVDLPTWFDVDTADDLADLRQRLAKEDEPALQRLGGRIDQVIGASR